jgi:hypothetical protein
MSDPEVAAKFERADIEKVWTRRYLGQAVRWRVR